MNYGRTNCRSKKGELIMKCIECPYCWKGENDRYPCCQYRKLGDFDLAPCELDDIAQYDDEPEDYREEYEE